MASSKDTADNPHSPVILSIQTDAAGHFVLKSSDGCRGGTFLNRYAALREIDDQICMSDRVTVVLIEPEPRPPFRQAARKNATLCEM